MRRSQGVTALVVAALLLGGCHGGEAGEENSTSTAAPTAISVPSSPTAERLDPGRLPTPTAGVDALPPSLAGMNPSGPDEAPDVAMAAMEVLPQCAEIPSSVPKASAVAARAYGARHPDGTEPLGHAVVLTFDSSTAANDWFGIFSSLIGKCETIGAPTITSSTVTDRRNDAQFTWSEAGMVKGQRAAVASVSDQDVDPETVLSELARWVR